MSNQGVAARWEMIQRFGGDRIVLDAAMDVFRLFWDMILRNELGYKFSRYRRIEKSRLFPRLSHLDSQLLDFILNSLQDDKVCTDDKEDGNSRIVIDLTNFESLSFARSALAGRRPDYEIRYFVRRGIRHRYGCLLSPKMAHIFHLLCNAINSNANFFINNDKNQSSNTAEPKPKFFINPNTDQPLSTIDYEDFLFYLQQVMQRDSPKNEVKQTLSLFIETCHEVGYINAGYRGGRMWNKARTFDAEYLLSNLFGMSTDIRGFDELFGGGGLILADNPDNHTGEPQRGRTVVIKGRYGTGKTLLSLQLAVEVARKGGLAWVMPLEQSAEECRYIIESMQLLHNDDSVVIADSTSAAAQVLQKSDNEHGALIILQPHKEPFEEFWKTFITDAEQTEKYPLRLLSVDPINSLVIRREKKTKSQIRAEVLNTFEQVERQGVNILLVTEESTDPNKNDVLSEQNIADTVIRLSLGRPQDYTHRYFEIEKSRIQREQRGRHPFSIVPGRGIRIMPSSAAMRARIRNRSILAPGSDVDFGLPSLDLILGDKAISRGDLIVLQGASGSFKTPLGLLFLLESDRQKKTSPDSKQAESAPEEEEITAATQPLSLLVAARDSVVTIKHMLEQNFIGQHIRDHKTAKQTRQIKICALPGGYVAPGYIFQQIEDEILAARLKGLRIDRIMIDDVAYWETGCPSIRDDETFGDTMVEFLRRQRVTSLLVCDLPSENRKSTVQQPIINAADCNIHFEQFEFRGMNRVMLKVLNTRGMRHRRESFEVTLGHSAIEVKPNSSLLRILRDGEVAPVNIRLFLHSETTTQENYNRKFADSMAAVLSRKIDIEPQDLVYHNKIMSLGSSSVVDELQIVQIDEFQLPNPSEIAAGKMPLCSFPSSHCESNKSEWADFLPQLLSRVRCQPDNSFFAVPYYENVSFLAYRKGGWDDTTITSWEALAEQCTDWENNHQEPNELFFDFPHFTDENYTCLFFEILLSLSQAPARHGECDLRNWLQQELAHEAALIFRKLCRRSHLTQMSRKEERKSKTGRQPVMRVNLKAKVWRHWYSTLNQMLNDMPAQDREEIIISMLPGGVTTAGEWYLGVPIYSAAPDVALEMIKLLTSHEAEMERMRLGIGLPTRSIFFRETNQTGESGLLTPTDLPVRSGFFKEENAVELSRYRSLPPGNMQELLSKAFRRSDFGCYSQLSNILAFYLQHILEIPQISDRQVEQEIGSIFNDMDTRMSFVRSARDCSKCKSYHPLTKLEHKH
jgi:KaiC/GvpD/RAD55 family RecA-like ATPase